MIDTFLPVPAPDFDQPLAVLKHCHDRIRKQLQTLRALLAHLPLHGADPQARQAAAAVLKYFGQAAPLHHADEEENLLPMLRQVARDADAILLADTAPQVIQDHAQMDALWQKIAAQLEQIAIGSSDSLDQDNVNSFAELYTAHMDNEEAVVAPMAKRLFSAAQMHELGNAMRSRRGV